MSWLAAFRRAIVFAALFVILAPVAWVHAQESVETRKLVAIHTDGPEAEALREELVRLMPSTVQVVSIDVLPKAMRASGLPRDVGAQLANRGARKSLLKALGKALGKAQLDAALIARKKPGKSRDVMLLFVETSAAAEPLDVTVTPASATDRPQALESALAASLGAFAPAPEPPPIDEAEQRAELERQRAEEDRKKKEFVAHRPGFELFEARVAFELGGRSFSYAESPSNTPNTRPYDVFGVPGLGLGGAVYPAATTGIPGLKDLGLLVEYAHFFGLSSQTADVRVFDTSWNRFAAGLRYRLRVRDEGAVPIIGAFGAFGFQNFTFAPRDARATEIENELATVQYRYLKGGLDARIPFGRVAVSPSFAYVGPLSGGTVFERFRGASLAGIEAGLELAVVVDSGIELRLGGDYTRFFASFVPLPGDTYFADGAADQIVRLTLGAAYLY
ncbi:MAG: hypothetical protein EXR75_05825 [Myxococcales bacterium]|nr:hypothetical protein [Myxococcales bacterium]